MLGRKHQFCFTVQPSLAAVPLRVLRTYAVARNDYLKIERACPDGSHRVHRIPKARLMRIFKAGD
jgi:hypothetical protein